MNSLSQTFYTQELETSALLSINLAVNKGEFVAIMGLSGCGKSSIRLFDGQIQRDRATRKVEAIGNTDQTLRERCYAG